MDKFRALEAIFRKYGAEYDFDYLMLAAQGYQESMLNQDVRGPHGGVGIMQVVPREAAASPIDIPDVYVAANNIHAAAKMLRHFADAYFTDPRIDPFNRALFVLASWFGLANPVAYTLLYGAAPGEAHEPAVREGQAILHALVGPCRRGGAAARERSPRRAAHPCGRKQRDSLAHRDTAERA